MELRPRITKWPLLRHLTFNRIRGIEEWLAVAVAELTTTIGVRIALD
jgi:hypothetical protein